MTARPRIAVVNEEIYRLTEAKYQKLMKWETKMPSAHDSKALREYNKDLTAKCDFIRKHGKKILTADIMLRDD